MKILVIDDEPLVRRSLVRAFEVKGHLALPAADGATGLTLWKAEVPDIVIVDVLMPGLSGPDVVRRAAAEGFFNGKKPYVVLISAFSGEDSRLLTQECGADCFVAKPFEDIFMFVSYVIEQMLAKSKERPPWQGQS